MTTPVSGRQVMCDGVGCSARADVPIALRRILGDDKATEMIDGWLFVASHGQWCHYCPDCQPAYLKSLDEPPMAAAN